MATTSFRSSFIMVLAITIGCICRWVEMVDAKKHLVGKSHGWDIPSSEVFYDNWAKKEIFQVGDELVFMYLPGTSDVVEVTKEDYEACTKDHVITKFNHGPAFYKLKKPGNYYFISGIEQQCILGLKLSISVIEKNYTNTSDASSLIRFASGLIFVFLLAHVLLH